MADSTQQIQFTKMLIDARLQNSKRNFKLKIFLLYLLSPSYMKRKRFIFLHLSLTDVTECFL